jgi:predicted O-methyltransferase YrrM
VSVLSHFLKWQFGFARAETQTTEAERDCLARHAAGKRVLAEIGVWHGVTTCRLRAAMATDGILYAIDPYPRGRLGVSFQQRIAHGELRSTSGGQIRWIRATGAEAGRRLAAELAARVDFVFIDGDHTYEGLRGDWEAWSGLLAPGGIVCLHDSRSSPLRAIDDAGSVRFTSEVIRKDERFLPVDEIDSLTVLRRRPQ